MGRGKLQLEFIANESSRRATFKRRKDGLLKKAEQFSILCGVDTCMVIYNPDDCSGPVTWPQDRDEVKRVIDRYLSEGVDRRTKRAVALPEFYMGRKRKLDNEIAKARSANWAAKYPVSDELIKGLSRDQLGDMLAVLQVKLETAKKRLNTMKENASKDEPRMDLIQTEDLEFNSSVHSLGHDQMLFGPTNMVAPCLTPPVDSNYSPMTWCPWSGQHGLPLQQQSLMFPYPMMPQGDTYYPPQDMTPDQEVQFDNVPSSNTQILFS